MQEMQTICCLEKGVEMILIHKGHKPPGPLEATSIPWELDMWLQTQLHIIGDKDLSAADVAVKVLELVMEKCGKRINAFRVFEEHLIDVMTENNNLRFNLRTAGDALRDLRRMHRLCTWCGKSLDEDGEASLTGEVGCVYGYCSECRPKKCEGCGDSEECTYGPK